MSGDVLASITCEVGYAEYNAVGTVIREKAQAAVLYETRTTDTKLINTCIEVCTTYTTNNYTFSSTYRLAGDGDDCSEQRAKYLTSGEPYNTEDGLFTHRGWRENEVFAYTSNTTVLCCLESGCNALCPNAAPPSLNAAAEWSFARCGAAHVFAVALLALGLLSRIR